MFLQNRRVVCGGTPSAPFRGTIAWFCPLQHVYLDHSTYAPPPSRFEPGTPAIAEAIGLGAAVDYLQDLGMQSVHNFEHDLGGYLHDRVGPLSLSSVVAADSLCDCNEVSIMHHWLAMHAQ